MSKLRLKPKALIFTALFTFDALVAIAAYTLSLHWLWAFLVFAPLTILAFSHVNQKKHTILANFPVLGSLRYLFEKIRPEMRQYFWESDLDGRPFNRRDRSIVYQRAKNVMDTVAFGMQQNNNEPGYEWAAHSVFPSKIKAEDLRVWIGNEQCAHPYSMSILNISAMSFGALSKTAIESLNGGAQLERFAHNTGEGGISPYHLKEGGDLIWQIGTGYFGCRDLEGKFSPDLFTKNAALSSVKMIELKLSQGAKPGHGGILPAAKNTPEVAAIRNVPVGTDVYSPIYHTAFSNATELIRFIGELRELSGGKPVGFKICLGDKKEFTDICEAILNVGIYPDFITIDGSEGGTGAAPVEFTDSLGMPLYDALAFASDKLKEYGLAEHVKIIASGKVITGFDIMKAIALGASACNSARGMMFALGCIQALRCNSGTCPAGVATQDPSLYKGLDVTDKRVRVASYHKNTIKATKELMEACGFKSIEDIAPAKFFRKIDPITTYSFEEIYFNKFRPKPTIKDGAFTNPIPSNMN